MPCTHSPSGFGHDCWPVLDVIDLHRAVHLARPPLIPRRQEVRPGGIPGQVVALAAGGGHLSRAELLQSLIGGLERVEADAAGGLANGDTEITWRKIKRMLQNSKKCIGYCHPKCPLNREGSFSLPPTWTVVHCFRPLWMRRDALDVVWRLLEGPLDGDDVAVAHPHAQGGQRGTRGRGEGGQTLQGDV